LLERVLATSGAGMSGFFADLVVESGLDAGGILAATDQGQH
jgi:hypothetical protein